MNATTKLKLRDCTACWLIRFIGDDVGHMLPIAPTAKNITFEGVRFFRLQPATVAIKPDGTKAAVYLSANWADSVLKKLEAEKGATE